jgi:ferredoxin
VVNRRRGVMPATRTLPNIEVDQAKCLSPMKCGKCLHVCPDVVLISVPKFNEKFRECSDDDFTISVHNRPACTGCMKCVEVCPVDCIKIEYEQTAATA